MYLVYLFLVGVILVGCTQPVTVVTQLKPAPNSCQTDTARPDYLSNSTFTHCWDAAGNHIGMIGGQGTTVGRVIMGQAGNVVGGAATVGSVIGASK